MAAESALLRASPKMDNVSDINVTVVQSREHRVGDKVSLGGYWKETNGPVLVCFFRRFG
jgi:hypothetical protein